MHMLYYMDIDKNRLAFQNSLGGLLMKKVFFILIILCLTMGSVFAMDISIGGKVNFNFNTMTADISAYRDKGFLFGGGVALIGVFGVNEFFAIQPEVALNCQNGMSYSILNKAAKISFLTIDIPILAKAKLWTGPGIMSINLGPQMTFIIGNILTKVDETKTYTSPGNTEINIFLFGMVAGLDYSVPVGPGFIVIDARFVMDFTTFSRNEGTTKLGNRMTLTPSLGYLLML